MFSQGAISGESISVLSAPSAPQVTAILSPVRLSRVLIAAALGAAGLHSPSARAANAGPIVVASGALSACVATPAVQHRGVGAPAAAAAVGWIAATEFRRALSLGASGTASAASCRAPRGIGTGTLGLSLPQTSTRSASAAASSAVGEACTSSPVARQRSADIATTSVAVVVPTLSAPVVRYRSVGSGGILAGALCSPSARGRSSAPVGAGTAAFSSSCSRPKTTPSAASSIASSTSPIAARRQIGPESSTILTALWPSSRQRLTAQAITTAGALTACVYVPVSRARAIGSVALAAAAAQSSGSVASRRSTLAWSATVSGAQFPALLVHRIGTATTGAVSVASAAMVPAVRTRVVGGFGTEQSSHCSWESAQLARYLGSASPGASATFCPVASSPAMGPVVLSAAEFAARVITGGDARRLSGQIQVGIDGRAPSGTIQGGDGTRFAGVIIAGTSERK